MDQDKEKCPSLLDDNIFANLFTFELSPEDKENVSNVSAEVEQKIRKLFEQINQKMAEINGLMSGQAPTQEPAPVVPISESAPGPISESAPTPTSESPSVPAAPISESASTPAAESEPAPDVNSLTPENIIETAEKLVSNITANSRMGEYEKAKSILTNLKTDINKYNNAVKELNEKKALGMENPVLETLIKKLFSDAKQKYSSIVSIYDKVNTYKGKGKYLKKSAKKVIKKTKRSKLNSIKKLSKKKSAKKVGAGWKGKGKKSGKKTSKQRGSGWMKGKKSGKKSSKRTRKGKKSGKKSKK